MKAAWLALVGALVPSVAFAATDEPGVTDTQLWTEIGARVSLTKKLRLSVAQLARFDENVTRFGKAAPEVALSYELLDDLRIHGGYRLTADRRSEGDWRTEHRIFVGGRYSIDVGPFEFGYRLEFEEDIYKKAGKSLNDNVLRNRVDAAYEDLDVIKPGASFEMLTDIDSASATGMRNWRATVGADIELGRHNIELYYRFRRAFQAPLDADHIVGVGYRVELGAKKKGKKGKKKGKKAKN